MTEKIHIIGGGTVYHVRPHLALSAPAYGATARNLAVLCEKLDDIEHPKREVRLHLTKMAGGDKLETNADIDELLTKLVASKETKVIFLTAALCDFEGSIGKYNGGITDFLKPEDLWDATPSGKTQQRLKTADGKQQLLLTPADKLIGKIRKQRKDIYLVGFKTTASATEDQMYLAGLDLLKKNHCNLVLVNDVHTHLNLIVAPELARYAVTHDREEALGELVQMMNKRSRLTFIRTTVEKGDLIPWDSDKVPASLRTVVDWCADKGAYKPFNDVTVGHFAFREEWNTLISSRRRQNYNRRECRDLVRVNFVRAIGVIHEEMMVAYGAKPSAGTRSQFEVLNTWYDNDQYDCIVHFHCPLKPGSKVNVRPQKDLECGSHECGVNTYKGITKFGNLAAVMLDKHGPNIIFRKDIDPQEVIKFIDENFDLSVRSDGMRE